MNLAKRLALLLAVPLAALLALGGLLDLQLRSIENHGTFVADLQLPSVAVIGNITRKHAELRVDLRDFLLAPGDQERGKVLDTAAHGGTPHCKSRAISRPKLGIRRISKALVQSRECPAPQSQP